MARIIVRAADTALAMDEVLDRLGAGAFILSTRAEPGGVVIEAATEPLAAAPLETPVDFAAELAARLADQAAEAPLGATPVDTAWRAAVAAELAGAAPAGPLEQLGRVFSPETDWPTGLWVLTGPVTEDLVLTAVRIAAAFRQSDPECRPVLMSLTRRAGLPAAPLQAWAQLLGLDHRLLPAGTRALPETEGAAPCILVAPSDAATPDLFASAGQGVLLVLPAGLHPRRLARHLVPWRGTGVGVCLTGIAPDDVPQPDDLRPIAAAGLKLRLVGQGGTILESLSVPEPAQLADWAHRWCAEAGLVTDPIRKESAA